MLTVKGLDSREWGTSRVRLHYSHRSGVQRYGLGKITNTETSKSVVAVILGHDDIQGIYMDYDTRDELGVSKGDTLAFDVASVRLPAKLWWYLTISDPLIRIPAWLAVWSIILGVAGICFGVASILGN
jgi:hypothetical protein